MDPILRLHCENACETCCACNVIDAISETVARYDLIIKYTRHDTLVLRQ